MAREAVNTYLTDKGRLLCRGTMVDASIIHAPSSTKHVAKARAPAMHQTGKGQQWYFGNRSCVALPPA